MITHTKRRPGWLQISSELVLVLAVGLATLAALAYLLIQAGVLGVGDLNREETPAGIVYICAGSYFLGGLLILLRRRWLWTVGAVINGLVMLFFFTAYQDRLSVVFSLGGLSTKLAQLLLEIALIYLIVTFHPNSKSVDKQP